MKWPASSGDSDLCSYCSTIFQIFRSSSNCKNPVLTPLKFGNIEVFTRINAVCSLEAIMAGAPLMRFKDHYALPMSVSALCGVYDIWNNIIPFKSKKRQGEVGTYIKRNPIPINITMTMGYTRYDLPTTLIARETELQWTDQSKPMVVETEESRPFKIWIESSCQ